MEPKQTAGALAPWDVGELPEPPAPGWRLWVGLLGPGIVLAGTAIGSGEWLFGPAVTAQYGGTLLWLATVSIVLQVFLDLMVMRYALYCGEPIIVGGLRTWPGPVLWVPCYLALEFASIWPYNASNAAVPLVAAFLGRLPGAGDVMLVKYVGYALFLLAFVPLIFGGTVYRMLEKIMSFKLIYVLTYLSIVAIFMVSAPVWWEVATGFFQFGSVPQRADTIIAGPHFHVTERDDGTTYTVRGTVEGGQATVAEFRAARGAKVESYKLGTKVPAQLAGKRDELVRRTEARARPGQFFVQTDAKGATLTAEGTIDGSRWTATRLALTRDGKAEEYQDLREVPKEHREALRELLAHQGLGHVNLFAYTWEHGRLPPLDWATVAAFAAIAGLGGLTNTMFSNYARDKGWGMGRHVGAIPSAIGGRNIGLSHTGMVFPLDEGNRSRWLGWLRHIRRDQLIWMVANFVGMALPCMLSLEFIRNATVEGNRVAAMTAEGMAARYPDLRWLVWTLTLFCGFIILFPGQVSVGDQIARRWTDIVWTGTRWARHFEGNKVKYLYYGILAVYAFWGLLALSLFDPFQIAKIGAVLQNVALGFSALHATYANRTLLPRELRPGWLLQLGTLACAAFFLGISAVVLLYL